MLIWARVCFLFHTTDIYLFCIPRPGISGAKSGIGLWPAAEQDAGDDSVDIGAHAACAGVRAIPAGGVPDSGVKQPGPGDNSSAGWEQLCVA